MPPKPPITHFLCIPLVTWASRQQLSNSLASFKADITSPDSFAVPEQAIRPVGTLHLTLGVMSLSQPEDLSRATALLKTLRPRSLLAGTGSETPAEQTAQGDDGSPSPIVISLRGLHSMQPTPSKSSVLYASPSDDEGRLMRFSERLRNCFLEAGLMVEDNRPLRLHATLLNTIYVKGRGKKRSRDRLTIDARPIIDRYEDCVWMHDVPLEKVTICKMGAKKQDDGDEVYEVEAEITI